MVADISASAVPALLNAYPDSEFYVSESAILDAISRRFQFNIIHPTSGLKVDVMIPKDNEYNKIRMQRKVRLNIDAQKMAWFSSAEDVILMKLVFFQLGGSDKHLRDIAGVFLVQKDKIDQDYLNQWSEKLGVADELQLVRDRLQEEQEKLIEATLGKISAGGDLAFDEMAEVISLVMQGKCSDEEIAVLLTSLSAKGETVAEIAGAARAMRQEMTPIHSSREDLLDTCGTGGSGSGTFNISTAAAIVVAACGVPVAKHGNRKISSKTGSADVLSELGINLKADHRNVERCLDEIGICFCFAPLMHPAMRHVGAVRKKLGVPTIFNMLGPLTNPASAPFQLLGVGRPELRNRLAEALSMLGTRRSLVVHGEDGMGEVTLGAKTLVTEATSEGMKEYTWTAADFGLEACTAAELQAENPIQSAAIIKDVFAAKQGPARDITLANTASALYLGWQNRFIRAGCQSGGRSY